MLYADLILCEWLYGWTFRCILLYSPVSLTGSLQEE